MSPYALFFRDTQPSIKVTSPNASFGEISKIVASLWESLNPEVKEDYKKRTAYAKKDYLKQLAAYRATQVSLQPQQQQIHDYNSNSNNSISLNNTKNKVKEMQHKKKTININQQQNMIQKQNFETPSNPPGETT